MQIKQSTFYTILFTVLFLILLFAIFGVMKSAHADSIDFEKCYNQKNHHCTQLAPTLAKVSGSNTAVVIHLPPNGSPVITGVFSPDNYTHLQNSVFVGNVQYAPTAASPTLNYCPQAFTIITNQGVPSYLDRIYNPSIGKNLTHYVYPDYCFVETGPNPIDGSKIPYVPEFGQTAVMIMLISLSVGIFFNRRRM